jgi:hypothetical protein
MKVAARVSVLLLLAIVAGCARSKPAPVVLPAGAATLVAQWSREGGFMAASANLIAVPDLAVYSDGRAIAAADTQFTLPTTEVTALVNKLNGYLDGLGPVVTADSDMRVADAPTTVFRVLVASGELKKVSAEALTEMDGYPDELLVANRMLSELAERVRADGTRYTADRVRMVVTLWQDNSGTMPRVWPASLPAPTGLGPASFGRSVDLTGADAATVIRELGRNYWQESYAESLLQLPDGTRVSMQWRYLLPTE